MSKKLSCTAEVFAVTASAAEFDGAADVGRRTRRRLVDSLRPEGIIEAPPLRVSRSYASFLPRRRVVQNEEEDTRTYDVVVNHEEQYSIWLKGRAMPAGWTAVGKSGLKAECLAYIEEVWTDMRPLSLRRHMEAFAAEHGAKAAAAAEDLGGAVGPQ